MVILKLKISKNQKVVGYLKFLSHLIEDRKWSIKTEYGVTWRSSVTWLFDFYFWKFQNLQAQNLTEGSTNQNKNGFKWKIIASNYSGEQKLRENSKKFEKNRPKSKKVDFLKWIDFEDSRARDMTICTSKERKFQDNFNGIKITTFTPTQNCFCDEKPKLLSFM